MFPGAFPHERSMLGILYGPTMKIFSKPQANEGQSQI